MQIVVFTLGGEEYALPITDVQEIIRYTRPRPVSDAGSGVQGVINLRGKVIPVCDLGVRLGLGSARDQESRSIVIVESQAGTAGVVVDKVEEVRTISEDDCEPLPASGSEIIRSIAKVDDRLIVLLEAAQLLEAVAV